MIGRVITRYELLEEVGHGGMAVVYRGIDTALGREVEPIMVVVCN